MLRSECRPVRAEALIALPPKLLAVLGLGFAMAACSADITRFDTPMFGLTGNSSRVSSPPVPRETVWATGSSRLADSTPSYDSGYHAPRDRYAAAPEGYAPPARGDYRSYDRAPGQPDYGPTPYRTIYEAPSGQTDRRAQRDETPAHMPAYQQPRDEPRTRVAALPPTTHEPYRAEPPRPVMETAPARQTDRPASTRPASASRAPEIEVQPGDTLYGLAERHGVSISELMTINGLRSPVLRPGQKIVLPRGARAVADARRTDAQPGGEPARIAALSEPTPTEPEATGREYPADSSASFEEMQSESEAAYEPADTYTIQSGESLYGIAVRYRVPLAELQRINGITDARKVRAGTVLRLPSSTSAPATEGQQAPRVVAQARPQPQPEPAKREGPAAPPAPAAASSENPAQPVIINAPRQRVAALDRSETTSDVPSLSAAPSTADERAPAAESTATAEEQADGVGRFRWPVKGRVIAGFGKQADGSHSDGIKLAVPVGTEVHAAESGVVAYAGDELKGYGNLVLIRHDNGWITAYAHNDELAVRRGDRVRRGQVIAKAGKTGNADTPQLHFELRQGSSPVDPIPHLEKL